MPDPASLTTVWDVLKAIVEHPYAPLTFLVFFAFLAALVHIVVSSRAKQSKAAYKRNEKLMRELRSEAQIAHAETRKLSARLEKCTDELNRLDAKYELLKGELDRCMSTRE